MSRRLKDRTFKKNSTNKRSGREREQQAGPIKILKPSQENRPWSPNSAGALRPGELGHSSCTCPLAAGEPREGTAPR